MSYKKPFYQSFIQNIIVVKEEKALVSLFFTEANPSAALKSHSSLILTDLI